MDKKAFRKRVLIRWWKSPKGRIDLFYIFLFIVIVGVSLFCKRFISDWPEISKKHTPEGIAAPDEQQDGSLAIYTYYLDYSPSMQGFITTSGGSMETLSKIFRIVNGGRSNSLFYRCYNEIVKCDANFFYQCMSNPQQIESDYERIVDSGMQAEVLSKIDLSKIFSDSAFSSGNDKLNVIITDLNFFDNLDGSVIHDQQMSAFSEGLAEAARKSNIAIYQFASGYEGTGIDDVNFGASSVQSGNASLLLIVFSENDAEYKSYIEKLEMYFRQERLTGFNKLEFGNTILQGNHFLTVDDTALYSDMTSKINFNFNNEYIQRREKYEIGLYITGENIRYAAFQGNVAVLDIETFTQGAQELDVESQIDTRVNILYPYGFLEELRKYEGESPVQVSSVGIVWDPNRKKYYLNIGIECDVSIKFPRARVLNKDYYVVEIQFFISSLNYVMPQWITVLDTEEATLNLEKKRGITEMVRNIMMQKEGAFIDNTEYEKYMGTLVFYISY